MKMFTAKEAIKSTSESIESIGGIGYMEDSSLPVYLRDS